MDEAHKELVKRLRDDHFGWVPEYAKQAATALEALAGERDRLKAALVRVKQFTKGGPDHVSDDDITEIFKTADAALGDAS